MELDVDLEGWPAGDWPGAARGAADAAAMVAPELANPRLQVSLLFTGDDEVRTLNREWRSRDKATNVLSFPMVEPDELAGLADTGPPILLGDLVLAAETCAREAEEKRIPLRAHVTHLIVHGLLHLAGYDHETGEDDAVAMENLEIKALAILGIADPYGDRE
ncbi:MAG: rRNA maturation RNase YbeY [Tsuneonella sp.]